MEPDVDVVVGGDGDVFWVTIFKGGVNVDTEVEGEEDVEEEVVVVIWKCGTGHKWFTRDKCMDTVMKGIWVFVVPMSKIILTVK